MWPFGLNILVTPGLRGDGHMCCHGSHTMARPSGMDCRGRRAFEVNDESLFPSESRRSLDCSSWSKFIMLTSVSFLSWRWSVASQLADAVVSLIENPNDPKQKLRHHRCTGYFNKEASERDKEKAREASKWKCSFLHLVLMWFNDAFSTVVVSYLSQPAGCYQKNAVFLCTGAPKLYYCLTWKLLFPNSSLTIFISSKWANQAS